MYSWSRRTAWSYRGVRMKVQHVPQHLCKACIRLSTRVIETEWMRFCFIFVTLCILCCLLFGWVFFRDPCFEWEIRKSLCNDYQNGLVAGSLCYDICVGDAIPLSYCLDQKSHTSVFSWEDKLIKARVPSKAGSRFDTSSVWDGMTQAEFSDVIRDMFDASLGYNDHSSLIERTLSFADFNKDDQLTYGEVNSVWQLLQIPEFHTLFIFQDNSVFPRLNGTCGSLYAHEVSYHQALYYRNSTFIDRIFPNRYRWNLPDFPKRMHIALGLLEYVYTTMETENTKFYMCNFTPQNFGYTQYFEMKVSNLEGIVSEHMLNETLMRIKCTSDSNCFHGDICNSQCNKVTHRCSGITRNYIPDIVKVCYILQDYIVFNLPQKLKYDLSHVVTECIQIGKRINNKSQLANLVDENLVLDKMNQVLWNELKYAENKWLTKPTKKPASLL